MANSNEETARMIAAFVGEVLEVDGQPGKNIWCLPFLLVKVRLDSSLTLPTGFSLNRTETNV